MRCRGWKRGACPCKNTARKGRLTCCHHDDQEEIIKRMDANDPYAEIVGGRTTREETS